MMRYPGAKWGIAEWIVSHFPEGYEKMVYLEPFAGSGAVFFTKSPGVVETINDLDGDVVNLFRILREQPEALRRALELTPYSREEYNLSFQPCEDPVERARRFMVRTNQAIGAKLSHRCGWRNHKNTKSGGTACKWTGIPEVIPYAAKRLRGDQTHLVQIERQDALKLIGRYDSPDVLMYLDPPYLRSTRRSGRLYSKEMDEADHRRLLDLIVHTRAKVVLSGYHSPLYTEVLSGWWTARAAMRTTSAEMREEVLWMNYEPPGQIELEEVISWL